MVLCAFHTKYTKHSRKRNYYLVYQRIEIISTNAYFLNSHNTCRYLYSRVPMLLDAFNRACMQFLYTIHMTITLVGVALGKIFISRLPHYNAIIPDRKTGARSGWDNYSLEY